MKFDGFSKRFFNVIGALITNGCIELENCRFHITNHCVHLNTHANKKWHDCRYRYKIESDCECFDEPREIKAMIGGLIERWPGLESISGKYYNFIRDLKLYTRFWIFIENVNFHENDVLPLVIYHVQKLEFLSQLEIIFDQNPVSAINTNSKSTSLMPFILSHLSRSGKLII